MKKQLFLFAVVLVCACSQKKVDQVIDLKDVIPQSERAHLKSGKRDDRIDSLRLFFDKRSVAQLELEVDTIKHYNEPFFLDRFSATRYHKEELVTKSGNVFFGQWIYHDSIKTMNAFYNWIDCFGPHCKSIKFLQSANLQVDNFLVFLNDTSITYLTSPIKLDEKKWQTFLETKHLIKEWDIVLLQKRKGKVNWMRYAGFPQVEFEKYPIEHEAN